MELAKLSVATRKTIHSQTKVLASCDVLFALLCERPKHRVILAVRAGTISLCAGLRKKAHAVLMLTRRRGAS